MWKPSLFLALSHVTSVAAQISASNLQVYRNSLNLDSPFQHTIPAYWTSYPHHRRTPFALAPNGKTAYLAYLDASGKGVHVHKVDPNTYAATGTTVTISNGKEAGGLVAHNDGFALLTNEAMPTGTASAPPGTTPVAVLYRYTDGKQTWKTWLGGPNLHPKEGLSMSADITGDLVFSEKAGLYGAYYVVTDYAGWAKGHSADNIQYIGKDGVVQTIRGATSSWGCSHNTGIAFEAADAPPFASACAEDHTGIWLNTKTQGMSGQKIANEACYHVINGATNSAMGGTSGSYSMLARFADSPSYIFTWVSRGAVNLVADKFLQGQTASKARWTNRHVAIAILKDKSTLANGPATSKVGSVDGDSQVNWITTGKSDHSNAHAATFDTYTALLSWEEIAEPGCPYDAMDCQGNFSGTHFQLVSSEGKIIGTSFSTMNVTVTGDMVNMPDGRICWPFVDMVWKLNGSPKNTGGMVMVGGPRPPTTNKMSFACMKKP
ncbi:hypothetical protein EJ08DRAFT_671212 [Tothia fuscella]|uniref:Uncharacterized protein n=1 Tax=Tothia fuscella TaxID=1048955 RepID=A0A9P4TWV2_9PEZI|nr:hypothetical protein EJ08DRAFT_671212 [Tothia fuscella]